MKTIKQIADELGVSKTAVRNKMTSEVQTKFAQTICGVIYILPEGEALIKQAFERSQPQTKFAEVSANQFAEVCSNFAVVLETLREQLVVKDKQLAEKDRQLAEMAIAFKTATENLQAAQVLHAGTMQDKFLPSAGSKKNKKGGFLSRFFTGTKGEI